VDQSQSALLAAIGAAALALALGACEGNGDTPAQPKDTGARRDAPEVKPNGTVHTVRMLTKAPENPAGAHLFEPRVVRAQVGDTITFVPTNRTHLSASIPGMLPEGARGWEGKLDEEVSYVVPMPGIYGYKCTPHYAAGMVGLVVVDGKGRDANLELAKAVGHPGLAGEAFARAFAEAGL
jgi:pseudoazurin